MCGHYVPRSALPVPSSSSNDIYTSFEYKHIVWAMIPANCTGVMNAKKIRDDNNKKNCKPFNTFIIGRFDDVKAACKKNEVRGTKRTTRKSFDVVDCRTRQKKTFPCNYTGSTRNGRIVVLCDERGFPYHLVRVIPQKLSPDEPE
uniref:Ribonuclease A-domain domain-containing protein n=1 Tax=Sander lucioperca TaxID=283035 RepID=A0A8D0D107_SANLU